MIQFSAIIKKFGERGEKSGWTYIEVPAALATQLIAGNKKAFRVKGKLDHFSFEKISLAPMGEGHFILPINAALRKTIKKGKGDVLQVQLSVDENRLPLPPAFTDCLADAPEAAHFFNSLPMSHQNYFVRWLTGVKSMEAQAKRMATAITALTKNQHYVAMIKSLKKDRQERF